MPGSKPDYEGHIPAVPAAEEAAEGEEKAEGETGAKKKFWQKVNVKGMKVRMASASQSRSPVCGARMVFQQMR